MAALEKIQFVGETRVLFTTIDTSGDGSIEEDEWADACREILGIEEEVRLGRKNLDRRGSFGLLARQSARALD